MPTIDGQFPDGVRMNLTIEIPYFSRVVHRFDMTPSEMDDCSITVCIHLVDFVVQLNFTLQIVEKNQILLRLKPSSLPSTMCIKRLTPRTNLMDTQVCSQANKKLFV